MTALPWTTFTFWTAPGSDLPLSWTQIRRRIAETEGRPGLASTVAENSPR